MYSEYGPHESGDLGLETNGNNEASKDTAETVERLRADWSFISDESPTNGQLRDDFLEIVLNNFDNNPDGWNALLVEIRGRIDEKKTDEEDETGIRDILEEAIERANDLI